MFTKLINLQLVGALLCLFTYSSVNAQNVGINSSGATPDASSGLDVDFSDKGILIPRVALTSITDATTIASPIASLLIYNTATVGTAPNNIFPGFYYWDGHGWSRLLNNIAQKTVLGVDRATVSTTLADVTGLSFAVIANKTYRFKFIIYYTANATGTGARFTLNGPTFAANGLFYTTSANISTAGGWAVQPQIAYNSGVALGSSYTTALNYCIIEGFVSTTAAGTVIARYATETNTTTTITVKGTGGLLSYVEWEQIN